MANGTEFESRVGAELDVLFRMLGSRMFYFYVKLLSELVSIKPNAADILLGYRPRSRIYFARSEAEIQKDHPYASIKRLRYGGLYAMCTLSNESKLTVLKALLGKCGLSSTDIHRILTAL